ncbi:MAG TPA: tripartite tricarboxylate transporter substrate binding protein [Burkholderiales bacterium]
MSIRLLIAGALLCVASSVFAQSYPNRTVRVIVPYPAGGGADFVARIYAKSLSDSIGQQFVVDNRGGANGNVGSELAAKSPPDGYTLLVTASTNLTINPGLYQKMPFDVQRAFAPISILAIQPTILVVHPTLPAKTVKELVMLAKTRPGQLNFGSAGAGSSAHLAAELFKMVAGVDIVHVPYKGTGPATSDLLGGQIPLMFNNLPPSLPLVKAGKLRALAVTGEKRSPAAPELPTMAEAGYPGVVMTLWNAMLAPAGTPPEILGRLHSEIIKAAKSPDVRGRLSAEGTEALTTTPTELADIMKSETARWAKVIKTANIALE